MSHFSAFCFGCIFGSIIGCLLTVDGSYKRGQIDAANGVMRFQLTTQPSGERLWVEKK